MRERIEYIDGLRGLAILLVVGYHAYSGWTEVVPYGKIYQNFPVFRYGWIGVELFFLISGFVIFLTLDKTRNFHSFVFRRWRRLFPAMFMATILIYFSSFVLHERPLGQPGLLDLIPGLTFIEPSWWSKILGRDIWGLEASFWSLYVEFKFYIVAGLIYFFLGRRYLIPSLLFFFLLHYCIEWLSMYSSLFHVLYTISSHLSFSYFGWFAAGSLFYLYWEQRDIRCFYAGFVLALICSLILSIKQSDPFSMFAAIILSLLFAYGLRIHLIQKILSIKPLLFWGTISYPMYLIHENALISILVQYSHFFSIIHQFFQPIFVISFLAIIAYFLIHNFEMLAIHRIDIISHFISEKFFGRAGNYDY